MHETENDDSIPGVQGPLTFSGPIKRPIVRGHVAHLFGRKPPGNPAHDVRVGRAAAALFVEQLELQSEVV